MRRARVLVLGIGLAVLLAACGGGEPDTVGNGTTGGGETVMVTGTDALAFDPETLSASAGELTVELTSEPSVEHTFVIEGINADEPVTEAPAGETATETVTLEPGSYTFYCSVPGHRAAGMEGTLTVEG